MIRARAGFLFLVALSWPGMLSADERPSGPIRLWPADAPGARGQAEVDIPTLTPFFVPTDKASGAAMIVCPGGGYAALSEAEGAGYAKWLNELGISAFVLKYRLAKNGYYLPTILQDAARAVRVVRASAERWQLDPKRVGMIGSSAGGHLTATLITRFDAGRPDASDPIDTVSSRPDAAVLCYAFILMDRYDLSDPLRRERLIDANPTPELIRQFSPALNVSKNTPPCFIWQTVEDSLVVPENAFVFADALRRAGVPFDLHLYQNGRHGIGLSKNAHDPGRLHPWTDACAYWLREQGFLSAK